MTDHQQGGPPAEERRRTALEEFLGAGMPAPPSSALLVQALASARRAVAVRRPHGLGIDQWLADEVHQRGIRENAAVLAAMEAPRHREETARAYREQHPDRTGDLDDLLSVLDRT